MYYNNQLQFTTKGLNFNPFTNKYDYQTSLEYSMSNFNYRYYDESTSGIIKETIALADLYVVTIEEYSVATSKLTINTISDLQTNGISGSLITDQTVRLLHLLIKKYDATGSHHYNDNEFTINEGNLFVCNKVGGVTEGVAFNSDDWIIISTYSDFVTNFIDNGGSYAYNSLYQTEYVLASPDTYPLEQNYWDADIEIDFTETVSCSKAKVNDGTSYPITVEDNSYSATDIIPIFFRSTNNFSTFNILYKDTEFNIATGNSYQIRMFLAKKWNSIENYDYMPGEIIAYYDSGAGVYIHFYNSSSAIINSISAAGDDDPANYTSGTNNWVALSTISNIETIKKSVGTTILNKDILCCTTETCPEEDKYVATECHKFNIYDDRTGSDRIVNVYDYSGELVVSGSIESGDEFVNLDIENDGVFTVEIGIDDGTGTIDEGEEIFKFPLYVMCSAEACRVKLENDLLCMDECSDKTCEEKEEMFDTMYLSMSIMSLIETVKKYVYIEKSKFIGIMEITSDRQDYIDKVNLVMKTLNAITDRCGNCGDSDSSSGCSDC